MKKRIISLLLALIMVVSLLPMSVLAAEGGTKPKMTAMKFAGTPTFDSQVTYHGQPEGTLFQVDENGNLGATGLAENCFDYSVYVSALEKSVRPEGKKALAIFNTFNFSGGCTQVVIKVGDDVLIQGKTSTMTVAKAWLNSTAELNETTTVMTIKLVKGEESSLYTVKFIKEKMSLDDLKSSLDKVNLEDLSNEENSRRMVDKLYQSFNDLSESDQQLLPKEYCNKLNTAYQKTRDLSKPIRLEIVTAPAKTDYAAGQTFDPTGVVIQAVYEDNSTKIINDLDWTYEPKSPLSTETEVTFTFNGLSVKQVISVLDLNMEGAGTDKSPYLLSTAENLENLRRFVELGGNTEGKHFRFAANITLPEGWKPIGCLKDPSVANSDIQKGANLYAFSGSIDGANYTLTVPKGGVPLLGYVKGAEVKNLSIYGEQIEGYGLVNNFEGVGLTGSAVVIDNVTLKSGSKTLKSGLIGANITTNGFAGCSAGFVATIRNCTIEKNVVVGYAEDQFVIGSIAGRLQGTVENCVSYATVKGKSYVGGIVGMRDNAMGQCEITNCRFAGNVIASGDFVGGIVGGGYGNSSAPNGIRTSVQGCVVSGTILGKNNVGGILGGDAMVAQSWDTHNFVGNTFIGKVSGEKNVGAIIGLYQSLNVFDNISGNVYQKDCGADRGIAAVEYVDTSYANPTPVDGVLYFNTAKGTENCPEVKWCNWKANLNRTDDPLGADADKLTVAVKDASTPVCYKLDISGDYKTTYTVGDSLDFSGAVITAHWTMGKADTIVDAKDITITGFDTNTRGQQTVTLSYGAAKAEITVTVLLPVGKDITVTFSLLGDSVHGNSGDKHTLADGNLEKWIDGVTVTVGNNATVLDVITKALGSKYIIENKTGNYIQSITPKDGTALGEFTNGPLSGWMYTLNGKHSNLGVAEQYLITGDVIVFHYTDDYSRENAFDQQKSADEVITMIAAIGTVSLSKGAAISQARAAYDNLTADEKALVTNYDKLLAAEAAYAKLVAEMGEKLDEIYKTTGDFMATLGTPTVNSIGGEWMVIGLARSGRTVPAGYYDNVVKFVRENADKNERLDRNKVTENARVILALTAIGKDVTNVGGHNLLKGLDNMAYVQTQGINGPIFTLIALDSHNYPTMGDVTREKLIQVILDAQLPGGGWTLSGNDADPDMTAMAIQSLAPYYKTNETVKAAVDKALDVLSGLQLGDGGFDSWGTVNSESCDQVIVALTALGIDPTTDSRFIKNGLTVLDALAGFYVTGGGFRHTAGGERNGMATEQGYYALTAYYRFANAQTRLYDMTDVTIQTGGSNTPATGDTGVLVWVIALPTAALAAAFVLKRKEREE